MQRITHKYQLTFKMSPLRFMNVKEFRKQNLEIFFILEMFVIHNFTFPTYEVCLGKSS